MATQVTGDLQAPASATILNFEQASVSRDHAAASGDTTARVGPRGKASNPTLDKVCNRAIMAIIALPMVLALVALARRLFGG